MQVGKFEKNRVEAFSDGVVAIIITIMVLELKVPEADGLSSLLALLPVFLGYILSFVYVGIYWANHHHLFHIVDHVDGRVVWANLNLMLWMSLIPFGSGYMAEHAYSGGTVFVYGVILTLCGASWALLVKSLKAGHASDSRISRVFKADMKSLVSTVLNILGLLVSWSYPMVGLTIYALVACIWFIPDRRIDRIVNEEQD